MMVTPKFKKVLQAQKMPRMIITALGELVPRLLATVVQPSGAGIEIEICHDTVVPSQLVR